MTISSLITGIGLACDIFGAIILAAPDVSLLAQKFEFGRLQLVRLDSLIDNLPYFSWLTTYLSQNDNVD